MSAHGMFTPDDSLGRLARVAAAIEDEAIRRQLVALGWTPPASPAQPVAEERHAARGFAHPADTD